MVPDDDELYVLTRRLLSAIARVSTITDMPTPELVVPARGVGHEHADWHLAQRLIGGDAGLSFSLGWLAAVAEEVAPATKLIRRYGPRSRNQLDLMRCQIVLDLPADALRIRVQDEAHVSVIREIELIAIDTALLGGHRAAWGSDRRRRRPGLCSARTEQTDR